MRSFSALAFRVKEAAQRRGTMALLPEVMAHQQLSPEQIQAQAWQHLQQVVRFAAASVPFYQQLWRGLDVEQALASPEAFARLPIIERPTLNAAGQSIAAPDVPGRLIATKTAGSSGQRLYFWSDDRRGGWSMAARIRAWRWWGLDYGARTVRLLGHRFRAGLALKPRLTEAKRRAINRLCGTTWISAYDMSEDDLRKHAQTLLRIAPEIITGYGGSLERLAAYMARQGLRLDRRHPKAVLYFSEAISEAGRQRMAQTFGAPVASEYVCREFGVIAHECPHGNLHISDDNLYLEVIDAQGRPVEGQVGEIILSDLRLSRTPYIRYRLGDLGELAPSDARCPCGNPQRVLHRLHGRIQEAIPLRNGAAIPPFVFDSAMAAVPGASHWQVRLSPPNRLRYLIEATPEQIAPRREQLLAWLNDRLNHEYEVDIVAVPHIAPAASGKYAKIVHEDQGAPWSSEG